VVAHAGQAGLRDRSGWAVSDLAALFAGFELLSLTQKEQRRP